MYHKNHVHNVTSSTGNATKCNSKNGKLQLDESMSIARMSSMSVHNCDATSPHGLNDASEHSLGDASP